MAVFLDALRIKILVFKLFGCPSDRLHKKVRRVVGHRVGLARKIVIEEQLPSVILFVGIGQRQTRAELHRVVATDGEIVPFCGIILGQARHFDIVILAVGSWNKVKPTHSTREESIEVDFLHDATAHEQFRAEGEAL